MGSAKSRARASGRPFWERAGGETSPCPGITVWANAASGNDARASRARPTAGAAPRNANEGIAIPLTARIFRIDRRSGRVLTPSGTRDRAGRRPRPNTPLLMRYPRFGALLLDGGIQRRFAGSRKGAEG